MALLFQYFENERLVVVRITGTIDMVADAGSHAEMRLHPACKDTDLILIDLSGVVEDRMDANGAMTLAMTLNWERIENGSPGRYAIYAPLDAPSYGTARMIQGFADSQPMITMTVCTDLEMAVTWLGLSGPADTYLEGVT